MNIERFLHCNQNIGGWGGWEVLLSLKMYLNSVKPQFFYYLLGCRNKKAATPLILYFKRDILMLHVHYVAHI